MCTDNKNFIFIYGGADSEGLLNDFYHFNILTNTSQQINIKQWDQV